jgi:DNA-binding NtrC family response regulator
VLLDVEMPGLSGVGVLPAIVALVPAAKVIMLSESENLELAKRSLAFGAFDHVTKPIDPPHLLQSIEAALAQRRVDLAG